MYLQLFRPSYGFNLNDPYCRLLENQYKSLHDPHLREYYKRKDILRRLKKGGYITSNNKVGCRLILFNHCKPPTIDKVCFCTSLGGSVSPLTWSWEIFNGKFHKLLRIWVKRNQTTVFSKWNYFFPRHFFFIISKDDYQRIWGCKSNFPKCSMVLFLCL